MYDNLNYEQFKGMSDEEKKELLQNMLKEYDNNPKIVASKISGSSFIAISNLIKRLIENKPVGRIKGGKNEPKVENNNEEKPEKRKYTRKEKSIPEEEKPEIKIEPVVEVKKQVIRASNILEGKISGDELIKRLDMFAKIILSDKEYDILIKIEEL